MDEYRIEIGDWVEITNGPSHFLGEIAEVTYEVSQAWFILAISFTPGHPKTNWRRDQIRALPRQTEYNAAIEVLGEDYFA